MSDHEDDKAARKADEQAEAQGEDPQAARDTEDAQRAGAVDEPRHDDPDAGSVMRTLPGRPAR